MATNPTAFTPTVTPAIFEDTITINVWGADGVDNPIQYYTVNADISDNGIKGWSPPAFIWTNVKPPSFQPYVQSVPRGKYLRVYTYAHGLVSNSIGDSGACTPIRRSYGATAPTTVKASPLTYSFEDITLEWSGAGTDGFSITRYNIDARVTYDNGKTFSPWSCIEIIMTSATSGRITLKPIRKINAQTEYQIWTINSANAKSPDARSSIDRVKFQATACTPPTAFTVSQTVAEGDVTLSWSGAKAGAGNEISGYQIEYSDSVNGTSWGAFQLLKKISSYAATSGNLVVSPPTTRGSYRRFMIMTVSSEGASYSSINVPSSNTVRKNILPTIPAVFSVSPAVYIEGDVTIRWDGITPGTSPVKNCLLQIATSSDNVTWSAYSDLQNIVTSETAGSFVHSTAWMEPYTRYRMKVGDALGAFSDYVYSEVVRREYPPKAPIVTAPKDGSVIYNPRPLFLMRTQRDLAGKPQSVHIKTATGAWQNSVDNPDAVSKIGELDRDVNLVFRHEEIQPGVVTVTINARDASVTGKSVTRTFTVMKSPLKTLSPNSSIVKAAHMLTLRSVVNSIRDYYGLTAFVWVYEIAAGKTEIKDWDFMSKNCARR